MRNVLNQRSLLYFIGLSEDEIVKGNGNYKDIRLLESDRWKEYLINEYTHGKRILAYHWNYKDMVYNRIKNPLQTVYKSINIMRVFKYCVVLLGLNMLAYALYDLFENLLDVMLA